MKPEQQPQGEQPTSMTGSDWQRQALTAARTGAAAAKHSDTASPAMEAARQRAAAQQVPDMLAAVEPTPTAATPQAQSSQSTNSAASTGEATGNPVVSGALAPDTPVAGAPVVGTGGASIGKKIIIMLLIFMLVAGAGAAAYFVLFTKKDTPSTAQNQQKQSEPVELATLQNVSFVSPEDDADFIPGEDTTGDYTTLSNAADTCLLYFGVVPQAKLSAEEQNKTAEQIVSLAIEDLKNTGFQVERSDDTEGLVLKDADNSDKSYVMPMATLIVQKDGAVGVRAFSIAVLADHSVASVIRQCRGDNSETVSSALIPFNEKARQIKVKVGS